MLFAGLLHIRNRIAQRLLWSGVAASGTGKLQCKQAR